VKTCNNSELEKAALYPKYYDSNETDDVVGRAAYINKMQTPHVLSGSTEGNRILGTCMDVKIKKQTVRM
jgi:RNA-binding protein YlmH